MTEPITVDQVVEAFARFSLDERYAVLESIQSLIPALDADGSINPRETYQAVDRAFADGWSHPLMNDYDNYPVTK
jgi:hypothetical protein